LPIGAAVANYALFSDPGYRKIVASQFNMLVPENELKAQFVHPQDGIYDFTEADSLVDFAISNNIQVHGHNLVFSEANPHWMQNAPPTDRQAIMTDHITTLVKHFGSKINEWDVVDEPLSDNDNNYLDTRDLRKNIWNDAMGESYIDIAFKTAHAANPSAKLYVNEYGIETDGERWNEFLALLKRLQARGVPINGVGFQAHVHEAADEINQATLQAHIKELQDMGLDSRISEMDVYGDDLSNQSKQYQEGLKACLAEPACKSFTMWGVTDRYGSTTNLHTYPLEYGNDLVWDTNLRSKPAYASLLEALRTTR
jgi:endo-1,4-beta-xylanase